MLSRLPRGALVVVSLHSRDPGRPPSESSIKSYARRVLKCNVYSL
jgi:hypothetical protein